MAKGAKKSGKRTVGSAGSKGAPLKDLKPSAGSQAVKGGKRSSVKDAHDKYA